MRAPALVLAAPKDRESGGWQLAAGWRAPLGENREWREMGGWESRAIQIFLGATKVGSKSRWDIEGVKMVRRCCHPQPCTVPEVRS